METTILVVEDDTMIRKAVARALENAGFVVFTANDGQEAWQQFQAQPCDMVVSDWMMPQLNGLDLCRKIRGQDDSDYTYFVLLTSRSDKSSLVEAMEAGADDFISKPFDDNELHARIRAGERILRLSHEVSRRLAQLMQANNRIRKLNLQMARDMKSLVGAIHQWAGNDQSTDDSSQRGIREQLQQELSEVIDDWLANIDVSQEAVL